MDQIIRVEKLSTFGEISASAEHTYRERNTPNADPKLTPFNVSSGAKGSKEVIEAVKDRLKTVKVSPDSVLCLEYLITASPEFFKTKTQAEIDAYWEKTEEWMITRHGAKNIIASDLQLDEKTPHKVYYVVPIVETIEHTVNRRVRASQKDLEDGIARLGKDGKTPEKIIQIDKAASSKLSAKHFNGGPRKMSELQTDFYENVSQGFGLNRGVEGSTAKHETVKKWYAELEPKMAAAQSLIDQAETVKKQQDEREKEIKKQAASIAKKVIAIDEQKTLLDKLQTVLQAQKEAFKEIFDQLPIKLMEKVMAAFKTPDLAIPQPDVKKPPKSGSGGLLDALKTSPDIVHHQKPR